MVESGIGESSHILINFDLIVKECKKAFGGSRSKAYRVLKKDMTEHGFIHDQGSGYISKESLTRLEILASLVTLVDRNPWLNQCCKRLRISKVAEDILNGEAHGDLLRSLNKLSESTTPKKPQKRVRSKLEKEAEQQLAEHRQAHLADIEAMNIPLERKTELRQKVDEIYSVKPPTIAEIKAELRGKSPKEIVEMSQQVRQKNKQNGKNSSDNGGKPPSGNGSGGNSGR